MKKAVIPILIFLLSTLCFVTACTGYASDNASDNLSEYSYYSDYLRNLNETNPLETMKPVEFSEGMIEDGTYLKAIKDLGMWWPNTKNFDCPTLDHLLYLYIGDYQGSGSPPHSLLIDFKINKIFYCKHIDLLIGNNADQMESFDLDESDIETIIGFETVQNIINWESHYDTSGGDCNWVVTLYFDDGSFFQSGGHLYPDVYKEFEEEIWPFIQEKTGDEFWWMRRLE